MPFIALLLATALTGFALGYSKLFWVGVLAGSIYTIQDKVWILQLAGALITIGPVLVYIVSGPMASASKKSRLMFLTSAACAIVYGLAFITGKGHWSWVYLFLTGLIMGVFSAGKMSCVVLESERSGRSPFTVNGAMSIVFLLGMLAGIPAGAHFGEFNPEQGLILSIIVFSLAAFASLQIRFPKESLNDYQNSRQSLSRDTFTLLARLLPYLIASPLIWGVASSLSLAVTAYLEVKWVATAVGASLVSAYSALGIILGNALAPKLEKIRYEACLIFFGLMMLLIISYPVLFSLVPLAFVDPSLTGDLFAQAREAAIQANNLYYWLAGLIMFLIGLCFGVVTNIIDAECLQRAREIGHEGTGAALQSAGVAFFSFLLGGLSGLCLIFNLVTPETQFLLIFLVSLVVQMNLLFLLLQYGDPRPLFGKIITPMFRFLVRLRYKVEVRGLDALPKNQGFVFLPNHPAEVDPLIIMTELFATYRPRPFVLEKFYEMPGLNFLMKVTKALAVPDTDDGAGSFKLRRIEKALDVCVSDIKNHESFLFYPAGRLMRSGLEDLRGASGLHALLKRNPKLPVVLVTSTGLWGSRFSTALTAGNTPDMVSVLKQCILDLLKNLIFFTPRRKVLVEFTLPGFDFPVSSDKQTLNAWMNQKLNHRGEEPLTLVSRYFFANSLPQIAEKKTVTISEEPIDETVKSIVFKEVSRRTNRDINEIDLEMSLAEDLGLDSLDRAEFLGFLDEQFHQSDVEVTEITSVYSLVRLAQGKVKSDSSPTVSTPKEWLSPRKAVQPATGNTVQECFLNACDRYTNTPAIGDEISGVLSYQRLKIGALALASVIRELPGNRIGLLMPASAGADVLIFATLLSGKIPVMINWTLGPKNLEAVKNVSEVQTVLTSRRFLDRAGDIDLGSIEPLLIYLEDLRSERINLVVKLKAVWDAKKSASSLMRELNLDLIKPEDPAVILFTSGSESVPKGVPLSHFNVLKNIVHALETLKVQDSDVFYGFLPPFHSFGFTVTSILPVITGIRCAYYPNPTDSRRLASGVEKWKISLMCGTPSFLRGILKAILPGQGKSLRYLLAGAEKADDELFFLVDNLKNGARLLEGYGITECSPIITVNHEDKPRAGVGYPLRTTELLIVDTENLTPLAQGERGLILVLGDSVFSGYLDASKNPFVTINNKTYYNTGDLGFLNPDGALVLAGRLKRFVKIAGEMISLPAMEDALLEFYPATEEGPSFAVEALEMDGERPIIALFCLQQEDLEVVNSNLRSKGFSALGRINQIRVVEKIPLLGTGKTDYRSLKTLLSGS